MATLPDFDKLLQRFAQELVDEDQRKADSELAAQKEKAEADLEVLKHFRAHPAYAATLKELAEPEEKFLQALHIIYNWFDPAIYVPTGEGHDREPIPFRFEIEEKLWGDDEVYITLKMSVGGDKILVINHPNQERKGEYQIKGFFKLARLFSLDEGPEEYYLEMDRKFQTSDGEIDSHEADLVFDDLAEVLVFLAGQIAVQDHANRKVAK